MDARGVTTTYSYDAESRLAEKSYSDSTSAAYYYYDEAAVTLPNSKWEPVANGKGRMTHTSTDSGNALTVESYDPMGRLGDFWQCTPYNCASGVLWDMHYAYEPGGMVDTYVHPAGYYIDYSVENDGRIRAINAGLVDGTHPAQLADILYAPQGAVSQIFNGCAGTGCNSIEELDDYNNRLERVRSQLQDYGNSAEVTCEVYNYYGNVANPTTCAIPSQGTGDDGNVLGQFYQDSVNTSLSHTASLAYDPTHRLTSAVATGSSTYNLAYSYDQFGNMTCQQNQQTQGLCPQYSFNTTTNQIANSGYAYDASGDLTNDGAHTYQYDAEGRLVSVDNGMTASYVYNALGERVEEDAGGTYSEYVFGKDGEPLGVNNRTSWVDTWVDFQGQHIAHYENNETFFVHSGRLGTAGLVTDYSGAVIQDELHYPWGQEWTMAGTMTEERFASLNHRDEATNLDPTHFRMYSSDQGRWLTPDPAPNCPFHPTNFDRYNYAANNPTNQIDPHGDALYAIELPYHDYGLGLDALFLPNADYPPGCGPYGCGVLVPPLFHISTVTCWCTRQTAQPVFGECEYRCNCSNSKSGIEWGSYWGTIREACGNVSSCPPFLEIEQTYLNLGFFGVGFGGRITHCGF